MGILDVFFSYFGYKGVITLIGLMVFVISFKYSTEIFDWIERQTYGTRNYLMDKFDRLYYQVDEEVIRRPFTEFMIYHLDNDVKLLDLLVEFLEEYPMLENCSFEGA